MRWIYTYYYTYTLHLFRLVAVCWLWLLPNNKMRLWNKQVPSLDIFFAGNLPVFQHRTKTLPNFWKYKRESLHNKNASFITPRFKNQNKGTRSWDTVIHTYIGWSLFFSTWVGLTSRANIGRDIFSACVGRPPGRTHWANRCSINACD
jgi:hypothetical protein